MRAPVCPDNSKMAPGQAERAIGDLLSTLQHLSSWATMSTRQNVYRSAGR